MKILFVCLFFIGSALAFIPQETALQTHDEGTTSANLNDYVDYVLPYIVQFMLENDLDPMDLPDIEESFSYKPLLITYHGQLLLTRGVFKNLRSLRRSGDVNIAYTNKIVKVHADFSLDNIFFQYRYLAKIMNLGPTGGVTGTVKTASVYADIAVDFNTPKLVLQGFKIHKVGSLSVKFSGNVLTDWLVNILSGVVTTLFKTIIMNAVEKAMRNAIQEFIDNINNSIANSEQLLEQLQHKPEQTLAMIMKSKSVKF